MRSILGVLSLLVALGIVAVIAKKQIAPAPSGATQTSDSAPNSAADSVLAPAQNQSPRQTQQQFKQALDAAVQSGQKRDAAVDEK